MGGLSPVHWLVVLLVVLLLFGAGRLAEIGKGLGEGIKNFKKGLSDDAKDDKADKAIEDKKEAKRLPSKSDATEAGTEQMSDREREAVRRRSAEDDDEKRA